MSDKVCIIGAGCCGMTAAKALSDAQIPFDWFEKGSAIGGNWRYDNDNGHSSAYKNLHIISSKRNMQFADFPMDDSYPLYCHHSDILRYFEDYARQFRLHDHATFNTEVKRVAPLADGRWEVDTTTGSNRYRAVMVANGHHWDPRYPHFTGSYSGETLHSHYYRTADPFRDKKVLIVGIGNSACDIAIDLCRCAAGVTISTRSSAHVIPKYIMGIPTDQWTGDWLEYLPLAVRRPFIRLIAYLSVGNQEKYGLPKPRHDLLEEHPTLNQEFLSYVGHGRVRIKPDIAELRGKTVAFTDGSEAPYDHIIYATGYNISFPFLDRDVFEVTDNRLALYRYVIDPALPNLFFMGLLQPLGAIMPLAEIQAKWVAGLLTGRYALPDSATMRKSIAADRRKIEKRYHPSPRHTIQVDFWDYVHQMRRETRRGLRRAALQTAGQAPHIAES